MTEFWTPWKSMPCPSSGVVFWFTTKLRSVTPDTWLLVQPGWLISEPAPTNTPPDGASRVNPSSQAPLGQLPATGHIDTAYQLLVWRTVLAAPPDDFTVKPDAIVKLPGAATGAAYVPGLTVIVHGVVDPLRTALRALPDAAESVAHVTV